MLFVPTIASLGSPEEIARAGGETAYVILTGLSAFFEFGAMAVALGAIILCQDLVIEEKNNGVIEWLLSKPVARRAYLLSKLMVNLIYCILFLIFIPAVITYGLFSLRLGSPFPVLPFLSGVGIMILHMTFYIALTLLLGVFFSSRAPVLGISLALVLGGNLIASLIKPLLNVSPFILAKSASLVAGSQPVPAELIWSPVLSTGLWIIIFIASSLFKFEHAEF
jgi:ABC-2 type transport system permease protein